jgi:hypothetical protein
MIKGMVASADRLIKTFPLRGLKEWPPYMHDGRLLTLGRYGRVFQPDLQVGVAAAARPPPFFVRNF